MKDTPYNPSEIEPKWQQIWDKEKTYSPDLDSAKKPFYNLMMFPYPSAEGMHVGNMYAFTGTDIYGRFTRMKGFDVLEPFGLDGFGIHSENYALKIGAHPMDQAEKSEKNFYRQMHETGIGVDWTRVVETYEADYYKWTQWLFTQMFKNGLAYRKTALVNYCPSCKTVLSDEQVIAGHCERCNTVVVKKDLEQWFFRITDYADRLLANIEGLNWTEKVKIAQRNWIGKSEGALIRFKIQDSGFTNKESKDHESSPRMYSGQAIINHKSFIEVFTTRPDTLFGATFMVISPEHRLTAELLSSKLKMDPTSYKTSLGAGSSKLQEIQDYVRKAAAKTEEDRTGDDKEKTGVFSGLYAVNPVNNAEIPIWIADYVLAGYGTGAIMAVPAHDERDFAFAQKYNLAVQPVVQSENIPIGKDAGLPYMGDGVLINSQGFDGLSIKEAKAKIVEKLAKDGQANTQAQYHLRDWLISRQRYWGAPIPMIFCESCAKAGRSWFDTDEAIKIQESRFTKDHESSPRRYSGQAIINHKSFQGWSAEGWYPVPDTSLPVVLPRIEDYKPLGAGASPLALHKEFYHITCPECGSDARRETDVADTFLDSSWYFLRYLGTDWDDLPFPSTKLAESQKSKVKSQNEIGNWKLKIENSARRAAWLPVNMYIGGAEHSVLHLLYARFVTMVFKDLGYIDFEEPFSRFFAHGLLIKEGAKMSKSKGNVIIPDEYIAKYGADTLRSYLMFLGPFSQGGDFQDTGIEGMYRFLKRVWKLVTTVEITQSKEASDTYKALQKTIKGVTSDLEQLSYNTAIAKMMEFYNILATKKSVAEDTIVCYLKLLAPFAPHMTEELYQEMTNDKGPISNDQSPMTKDIFESIHLSSWPELDESVLGDDSVMIIVQVNGKLRDNLVFQSPSVDQKEVEDRARASEKVAKYLAGGTVRKIIYVPNKLINFVVA